MSVDRVLFVVQDPQDLRDPDRARALAEGSGAERALCLVADGDDSGLGHLRLQQRLTVELRACLGADAEAIPTFVVTSHAGDDVDSCASGWGATRVIDLRVVTRAAQ